MIACDRPLVYRWLTNRLTWASLGGGGGVRWRCSRQRELANPVIRIWWLNVEKIFAYSATIISWIRSFCRGYFSFLTKTIFCYLPQKSPRATFCHFCWHFALSLLDKILTPLKGRNKGKKNWSAGSLFPIPFLLPVSPGGSTAKTIRNSHKWACSQTGLSFIWG